MDNITRRIIVITVLLGILAIILSGYALHQVLSLSLPFPRSVTALSLTFPTLTAVALPLSVRLVNGFPRARTTLFIILAYLSTIPPIVFLVISSVYGAPTSLLSCSLEDQWSSLFRLKNDRAIRDIQDILRCCGLNSMRDRAWPFPRDGVAADECERTQGYHTRCVDLWRRQESTAASIVGLANICNWILIALLIYTTQLREQRFQVPRFLMPGANPATDTRLLGEPPGDEPLEEQSNNAGEEMYTDIPHPER